MGKSDPRPSQSKARTHRNKSTISQELKAVLRLVQINKDPRPWLTLAQLRTRKGGQACFHTITHSLGLVSLHWHFFFGVMKDQKRAWCSFKQQQEWNKNCKSLDNPTCFSFYFFLENPNSPTGGMAHHLALSSRRWINGVHNTVAPISIMLDSNAGATIPGYNMAAIRTRSKFALLVLPRPWCWCWCRD